MSIRTNAHIPHRYRLGSFVVVAAALASAVITAGVWTYGRTDSPAATIQAPALAALPAASGSFTRPVSAVGVGHTIYLVSSNEQAVTTLAAVHDGNAIHYSLGEQPLLASAMVVSSAEQSAEVMNAVAEGNLILASLALGPDAVVDLRGR